ncbi:CoA-transferase [Leifsonia sp. C5G2]|jgi:acyl CoA:acetate/3-ketoacid CoA transferase alpha subunit|uniref:CoA-transferase n=1 Tax=Leifsonia sp. C5G2 TaxID=2735269 RepID=UPI0015859E17|nr:CoA-transferase [Leifsonia sp. C5G2]NUU08463.1 hypothetical protein [Leifsonia sp. C5G2]
MTGQRSTERLVSLAEAARAVPDGAVVAIGGPAQARRPLALVRALARQGTRLSRLLARTDGPEGDLLGVPLELMPDGEALHADVLLLHADAATLAGDLLLVADPDEWYADRLLGAGAGRVIATVEQLVSPATALGRPRDLVVPGEHVVALAHTPFGAHPLAFAGRYPADPQATVEGPEAEDHWAYLDAIGYARLVRRATELDAPSRGESE